jgi:hypothetical protein
MPQLYPNTGALFLAGNARTALAASKIRLFQDTGFIPTAGTTLADLEDIEADYSGYAAGGIAVTNFTLPLLNASGGASIQSGLVQFTFTAPADPAEPVPNVIGGFFLEDATGKLVSVGTFPNGVAMQQNGQGIPMNVQLVFGTIG